MVRVTEFYAELRYDEPNGGLLWLQDECVEQGVQFARLVTRGDVGDTRSDVGALDFFTVSSRSPAMTDWHCTVSLWMWFWRARSHSSCFVA